MKSPSTPQDARTLGSSLDEFAEHLFGVDGDEDTAAAGQDFAFLIEDFGGIDVLSAVHADFSAFDPQRLLQRDGLQVFHRHLFRDRNHVAQLIRLAHGVVEDGGDDAAMAVAGRSGVALGQAEVADEGAALFVERELGGACHRDCRARRRSSSSWEA